MSARIIGILLTLILLFSCAANAESVTAISRGGTVIARFTGDWIDGHKMEEVFSFSGVNLSDRELILQDLRDSLTESEYDQFIEEYDTSSSATIEVPTLMIDQTNADFTVMSMRRIGNDTYLVLRPDDESGSSISVNCAVSRTTRSWNGFANEYLSTPVAEAASESVKLKIKDKKVKQVRSYESGDVSVNVLSCDWGGIAVFHAPRNTPGQVRLRIGNDAVGIALTGYDSGKDMVYCCVLTDSEYEALKGETAFTLSAGPSGSSEPASSGPFYIAG